MTLLEVPKAGSQPFTTKHARDYRAFCGPLGRAVSVQIRPPHALHVMDGIHGMYGNVGFSLQRERGLQSIMPCINLDAIPHSRANEWLCSGRRSDTRVLGELGSKARAVGHLLPASR